jgi:hypothetical protein
MKSTGILLLLLLIPAITACSTTNELAPFTTDGCSHFPDGTSQHKNLWLKCCIAHDKAYWKGGTYQERLQADLKLRECVAQVADPLIAELMLNGVRAGGSPFWPTQFRWGYGWPYLRGYKALSKEELELVNALDPDK